MSYLRSLRLQAMDKIDFDQMLRFGKSSKKPKLLRAIESIQEIVEEESGHENL
jgi:hypothetical protein